MDGWWIDKNEQKDRSIYGQMHTAYGWKNKQKDR